jgi:hypothetical protein
MLGCHSWHANAVLTGVEHRRTNTDVATQTAGLYAQDLERTGFALLRIRRSGFESLWCSSVYPSQPPISNPIALLDAPK